jgi:hypothetical protein
LALERRLKLEDYQGSLSDGIAEKYGEEARKMIQDLI